MSVIDLFSEQSDRYAAARPQYPRSLYQFLATVAPQTGRVWDCATGNGQAAIDLADFFAEVEATDVSSQQITHARSHPNVRYTVHKAEATSFPNHWFDAVVVAQALHWFDFDRFWPEVQRVLKPGGIFAAWGYGWFTIHPAIDPVIQTAILDPVAPFWSPRIQYLLDGYRDVGCPFQRLTPPPITMTIAWTLPELLAYFQTWSATRQCIQDQGPEFFDRAASQLAEVWGDPNQPRTVTMNFHLLVGQAPAQS